MAYAVPALEPVETFLYLAPLAPELQHCPVGGVPPPPPGALRLVCISDTHNEHEGLRLPAGDVLVHSGDVLTESGLRHVSRDPVTREILQVQPAGVALLENFARWLGSQTFAYKVVIGGNHDLVLQGLGRERVQEILAAHNAHGEVAYLQDSEALLGRLRVYGSPYAAYSSHNDAFKQERPVYNIQPGVHLVVTHMAALLPSKKKRGVRGHEEITRPLLEAGALLHVGGHCHWAHGLYFAEPAEKTTAAAVGAAKPRVPCVVASICQSHWLGRRELASASGFRGDPLDKTHGGYNLVQPGIICDLVLPEVVAPTPAPALASAAPEEEYADDWNDEEEEEDEAAAPQQRPRARSSTRSSRQRSKERLSTLEAAGTAAAAATPAKLRSLLFAPPNDPGFVESIKPLLEEHFVVDAFESAADCILAARGQDYASLVAKLGQEGNLGVDIIAACRGEFGSAITVAIHSATVARRPKTRERLAREFGVHIFAEHGEEVELVRQLAAAMSASSTGRNAPCKVLLFAPPNDPDFAESMLLVLEQQGFIINTFAAATDCIQAVERTQYAVCVAKLGQKGNLGIDVLAACRRKFGPSVLTAIHSATAARSEEKRMKWAQDPGVDYFVEHGAEAKLAAELARAVRFGRVQGPGAVIA